MDFLSTNGYLSVMQKEEYDQALAEVSNLTQMNEELQNESDTKKGAQRPLWKKRKGRLIQSCFILRGKRRRKRNLKA